MASEKKKKKGLGKIEKIILIIIVIIGLCGLAYKPFLEKFFIPHAHDKISQEAKKTSSKQYAKNLDNINTQLDLQNWSSKANKRFQYNDKPKNTTPTMPGQKLNLNDLRNIAKNQMIIKDNDKYNDSLPDLTYDYSKVKPASELDLSTLNPNYDKRLLTGHISMPAINTNLPILEGVSNENLYAGAGTLKPYQQMGKGNYALASHFMPDGVSNFSKIGQLQKGNMILLSNGKNIYRYKTISVRNMPINSSSVVNDVKGKKLVTLVTCTDIYGSRRTVVQGEFVNKQSINSQLGKYFK